MAFQCLDKLTVGSTTYNLAQVTDFSVIPSSLESASPCSMVGDLRQSNAGVLPACLSTFGDLFMDCTSGTGDTMVVKDDEYFGIKIGRVHHGDYYSDSPNATGWVTQDKVANRLINNMGWVNMSGNAFRLYFAVVYDTSTERAYFIGIRDQYQHWGGNTGCFFHIFGGLSNGVDILYQSFIASLIVSITSNGGGATHIAKVTGQLKDLSSNLSDILMVSGGGGGGLLVGDTDYSGKEAGGISGSGDNSADQSTGNAFGQGESGTNVSGGGSGLYGGYKGTSAKSGGAGSGYIGNSLVSNKKMVGYNVPTSSAEGTKTESVNEVSASAVSGKPKSGNGFARIKFLREVGHVLFKDIVKTTDKDHEKHTSYDGSNPGVPVNNLSSYFETDYILSSRQSNANYLASFNGNEGSGSNKSSSTSCIIYYPIPKTFIKNVKYKYKFASGSSSQYAYVNVGLGYVENGQIKYADNVVVKSNTNYQTDWKEVSFTINTPKLFDYLVMWVCDYTWMFKDVEFNYE